MSHWGIDVLLRVLLTIPGLSEVTMLLMLLSSTICLGRRCRNRGCNCVPATAAAS